MQNSQKEEPEENVTELTFGILADDVNSEVNTDVNLSSLSNVAEHSVTIDASQVGGEATTDGISSETVTDGINTATSLVSTSLLPENLVLVETSKGLVGYASISTSVDEQGRQLITPTLPVALFNNINSVGIGDGQESGLFGGSPPDGITVTTTASLFDDSSPNLQSASGINVPVQLISSDMIIPVANENIPSSPDKRKKGGGWPKGKKRKPVPDVPAPKKPATGYVLYAVKRRKQLKVANPKLPFSEVTKLLGQEWTNLPEDTKKRYLQLAEKDKKRYIREMKQFQHSEHYQNYLKKRKLSDAGIPEMDSLIDLEGTDGEDELQCKICNQFFISVHNKKEHMFGRQHLMAITKQIQKDIQAQTELQNQQALAAASLDSTAVTTLVNGEASSFQKPAEEKPVDVDEFIQEFMRKNQERQNEIEQLLKSRKSYQEDNDTMTKQMKELQELEAKLDQDIGSLKAYGSSLTAQIDTLKMVPTLFGFINF